MRKNKFKNIAKQVIQNEIDGLKKLKSSIGSTFEQIIKTILKCKNGKVIVSGVGKSGIIGKKWAATFSSTGTPSFFMDASNASHGDMGQINSNDIVILISLSGSSTELKNISGNAPIFLMSFLLIPNSIIPYYLVHDVSIILWNP